MGRVGPATNPGVLARGGVGECGEKVLELGGSEGGGHIISVSSAGR